MNIIDWWKIFPLATANLKPIPNDTGATALPQEGVVVVQKNAFWVNNSINVYFFFVYVQRGIFPSPRCIRGQHFHILSGGGITAP